MDDNFWQYLEKMLNTDDVLFNWTMITGDETEKEEITHGITKLWIISIVKSVMEKYRSKSKKRTAKSKGLRTRCFTDKV